MHDRRQLSLLIATAALFILGAWPLLLCDVPPLEDLPAHLATAVVIDHPAAYADFVFHGFLKSNTTLFLWLHAFGEGHLVLASKLFVALVVLAHAWVLPRLVVEIGGAERLVAATLLSAPLVHNWFVAMGMLDYALASALGLGCLLLVARQIRAPSRARAIGLGVLGVLVWYTHVLALGFVALVALVAALRSRAVLRAAAPLGVALVLAIASAIVDVAHAHTSLAMSASYRPPREMVYELWAKYPWSFTKAELTSLVTPAVLAIACWRERNANMPLLSMTAGAMLLAFYFLVPHEALGWGNVSTRALPFLYAVALVRSPVVTAWAWRAALAACAIAWSVGLGIGYARLTRDYAEIAAGTGAVPEGADLLPLVFEPKGWIENTWALETSWGLYVVAKHTSAPLLFAHLPGHPVGYRGAPPEDPMRIARDIAQSDTADLERAVARHPWILEIGRGFEPAGRRLAFERGRVRIYAP